MPAKRKSSSKTVKQNETDLALFRKLFWEARKAHREDRKNTSEEDPAHLAALAFANDRDWKWASTLLEALLSAYRGDNKACLDLLNSLNVPPSFLGELLFTQGVAYHNEKNFDAAIECYRKALDSPGFGNLSNAWHNIGLAETGKKNIDAAIDCYRKALDTPGFDRPGNAWNNMGVLYRNKNDFDTAIRCYRKAIDSPGYETPGKAWSNMGSSHTEKKEFDAAIECYHKAIISPDIESPGVAWNNMGLAYAEKKEFDSAIDCYRKALDSPDYDDPGYSWNNMGIAQAEKNNFDAAIDCYRKALDSPGFDVRGNAWNNMGIAYAEKEDFDTAIDCYREALDSPGYMTPHLCRLNLSTDLRDSGHLDEAESEIQRVLAEPDTEGQHARARLLLSLLEARRRDIAPKPEEEALAAPMPKSLEGGPEQRMQAKLVGRETSYDQYLAREIEYHPDDLTILRGWSSSVTLLEGGTEFQWRGGGYFLKWQGKGIVIDPGFDFLDNFHDAGFHAKEINAVLVSHNHPDHNEDLGILDNLCYELFWRSETFPKSLFAIDEDTASRFGTKSQDHRGSPLKLDLATYQRRRWIDREDGLDLTIEHFPVDHGIEVPNAMGLRLRLHRTDGKDDLVIGYTADGKFTERLVEHLRGIDVLIAHVSQPHPKEFLDPEFLKDVHLGYNGVTKLVRELTPKLTLVGEFWAGLADLRLDLIAGIRLRSGVDAVLPACLGLSLRLEDLTVRCTSCRSQVSFDQIKVTPPTQEFGLLGYLCPGCII